MKWFQNEGQVVSKLKESEESYLRASNAIKAAHIRLLQEHVSTLYWTVVPIVFVVGATTGYFLGAYFGWL